MQLVRGELKTREICAFVLMSDGTAQGLYNKREQKLADAIVNIMKQSYPLRGSDFIPLYGG